MDIKKLAPWNWFQQEEEAAGAAVPQRYRGGGWEHPIMQLHREMDQLFSDAFKGFGGVAFPTMKGLESFLKPKLDIVAGDKDYTITVEVPGVDENKVNVEIVDDTLVISGEKKQEKEEKGKDYHRMERSYGSFRRILSLPGDADQQAVKASFNNGVLTLTMPRKAPRKADVRRIEVKSGGGGKKKA